MIYSFDELSFQILTIKKVAHEDGFFKVKARPFSALAFRIKGEGVFEVEDKKIYSRAGDILYLPNNMDYKVDYSGSEIIVVHLVNCNYGVAENINTDNYNFFYACFSELVQYWDNTRLVNGVKARIYKILQILSEKEKLLSEDKFFNNCVDYINKNFTDPSLKISMVCKNHFISESGLRRRFSTYMKMSPKEYLLKLRVDKAVNMLTDGKNSVKEVAEMCGFSDEKYFSRVIKNKYKIPPSLFSYKIGK